MDATIKSGFTNDEEKKMIVSSYTVEKEDEPTQKLLRETYKETFPVNDSFYISLDSSQRLGNKIKVSINRNNNR